VEAEQQLRCGAKNEEEANSAEIEMEVHQQKWREQ
jgi:hypothetical protein